MFMSLDYVSPYAHYHNTPTNKLPIFFTLKVCTNTAPCKSLNTGFSQAIFLWIKNWNVHLFPAEKTIRYSVSLDSKSQQAASTREKLLPEKTDSQKICTGTSLIVL